MILTRADFTAATRAAHVSFLRPARRLLIVLALLSAALPGAFAGEIGVPVRVELGAQDPSLSRLLDLKVDVDGVFDGWARVYVTESGRAKLEHNGFRVTLLPNPERALALALLDQPPWDKTTADGRVPTVYHTYTTLTTDLQAIAAAHPDIARLSSIGQSVQGRQLWMMKLSDNPDVDEEEPELSFISSMHGDEVVGKELAYNLIDYLTANYGTDSRVTDLLDGAEVWIMPSMNPDGTQLGQRWNANNVDLNRDFPDQFIDAVNTAAGRQVETAAVMQWATQRRITIAANFHGGELVANYPFDSNPAGTSTFSPSPDHAAFLVLARTYADNNIPMSLNNSQPSFDDGITNGADWYSINGGMQDWNYVWNGGFEVLLELSTVKWPPGSQLPTFWSDNFESMMSYLELGFRGLRGVVTDALTGDPVAATVTLHTSTFPSYTDPEVGDYHRFAVPGTYNVTVSAAGYASSTATGVTVAAGPATRHDVALQQVPADLQFGDATVLDGVGGDGWLDPGEAADLSVTLENLGGSATGVTATLESTGPFAEVVRAEAAYPDIAPGGSAQSLAPHFRVSLPAGVPLGHRPGFVLHWQADQASGVSEPFFLEVGAPQCVTVYATDLPKPITDFQTTTSQLQFTTALEIAEARVPVNLTHTYIGDLDVRLVSPGGKTLQLHGRSGGSSNDIVGTYGDDLTPVESLSTLIDTGSAGAWQLRVTDAAGGDSGALNLFGIEVCGHPEPSSCVDDVDCDDGLHCNGAESCNAGDCQPGTPPACSDGVGCTTDTCNEATDGCDNTPADPACDNGLFCDGAETCHPTLDCRPGAPPACDDGVGCTTDACNEATDACETEPDDGACDNGLYCDGAETCDPILGCRAGVDPCPGLGCDDGLDECVCQAVQDCDDGLFCNGLETCDGIDCLPGGDPCAGQPGCDEEADRCISGPLARLETHVVSVGGSFQTVALSQTYVSPVVVCSAQYAANGLPIVTRVRDVTPASFQVRLQNPSDASVVADLVHCLVVEQGVWDVDGLLVEAFTTLSTVTDDDGSWLGQVQAYGQAYASPVVLGQVMTQNDADWSVFWSFGTYRSNPPTASALRVGKHVGSDPDTTRSPETLGVIVLEAGHGSLAGTEYEVRLGPDTITGVTNGAPHVYTFAAPFAQSPTVAVVSQSAMDGTDGSWGQVYGASPLSTTRLHVSVDEDQLADAERSHVNEQLAYAVFAGDLVYSAAPPCGVAADCDDGLFCNGVETCDAGACRAGTPVSCDDGVGCTVDACNEATDDCDHAAVDAACDNGLFCDGAETCDPTLDCRTGTPPSCDDGVECTNDSCNETTDGCDHVPADELCDNGVFCDGAETCDALLGCQAAADPCPPGACDESLDQCVCLTDEECDDGLFCNGLEGCNGIDCVAGSDPCSGQAGCDEGADQCLTGPVARLETHVVSVGGSFQTVTLAQTYVSPVVVCSAQYAANGLPIVTRVRDVTPTSFQVRLQNPSDAAIVADLVHCLVVEQGVWEVEGLRVEAFTRQSTVTDDNGSWLGQVQAYGQGYSSPVVLGQVMTQNDADWSVFWSYGTSRSNPPTASALRVGKHVGSDPDTTRSAETLGVIVLEAGHGSLAGIEYEIRLGPDTVTGVTNGAPHVYTFATPFGEAPTVAVVTQSAMDGSADGSWGVVYGASPLSATRLHVAVDEDQLVDAERSHVNEQLAYAVFAGDLLYPAAPACDVAADCDDGLSCNGVETCDAGACQAGTPVDCDDGLFCNGVETCDEGGCLPGNDPCVGAEGCDESAGQCITSEPVARLETHVVAVDSAFQSVALTQTFVSPVVVCSPQYAANSLPIVTRVRNVTATSFEVRLQNPSGSAIVADTVHCLVVEEGVWTIEGLKLEAFTYLSTVTDNASAWTGEARAYGQAYASPVVLGQVMTQADAGWSVFWDSGASRSGPPTSAALRTGKHVGWDPDTTRAPETIGVIVLERGHGQLGGIEYEAALGADTVAGVVNAPPHRYNFTTPFATVPTVAVVTQAAMDGGADGSWAQLYGTAPLSRTTIGLAVDEDQLADAERSHTTEQVAYVAFAGAARYP